MKEKIEKRITELEKTKQQFVANVNACDGALEVLKGLLEEETKVESIKEVKE